MLLILDRFGGDDNSEKLIDAIRGRDESAISTFIEENPKSGELLVAGILFVSHETPYSHVIPPSTLELVKKHTTSSSLIATVMSFWQERPSTGIVLVMKYVDLEVISVADIISWLLEQDTWMRKSWGWEIIQVCSEKLDTRAIQKSDDGATADAKGETSEKVAEESMQVDSNGTTTNGTVKDERRELFEKLVAGVDPCYQRQSEQDQHWLKEWFVMIVRKYHADVVGLEGIGWVGEILADGEEYRKRLV
jgi:hypothetical protein